MAPTTRIYPSAQGRHSAIAGGAARTGLTPAVSLSESKYVHSKKSVLGSVMSDLDRIFATTCHHPATTRQRARAVRVQIRTRHGQTPAQPPWARPSRRLHSDGIGCTESPGGRGACLQVEFVREELVKLQDSEVRLQVINLLLDLRTATTTSA